MFFYKSEPLTMVLFTELKSRNIDDADQQLLSAIEAVCRDDDLRELKERRCVRAVIVTSLSAPQTIAPGLKFRGGCKRRGSSCTLVQAGVGVARAKSGSVSRSFPEEDVVASSRAEGGTALLSHRIAKCGPMVSATERAFRNADQFDVAMSAARTLSQSLTFDAALTIAKIPALIASGSRSHASMTAAKSGSFRQVSVGIWWETAGGP